MTLSAAVRLAKFLLIKVYTHTPCSTETADYHRMLVGNEIESDNFCSQSTNWVEKVKNVISPAKRKKTGSRFAVHASMATGKYKQCIYSIRLDAQCTLATICNSLQMLLLLLLLLL